LPFATRSIRSSGPEHRRRHGGRRLTRSLAPESSIGKRSADHLDGVLHDRVQREALERHHHAADLIPGERPAIDDEKWERTFCLRVPLDDAAEPVRLRELPPVLGLLDVSNAEPLADSLAQEREQVPGVGLEIAEDLEPITASRIAMPDFTRVHGVSGANQHRSNLEPVPHAIDIGDHNRRDGRVVEVDAEALSQLLVETAATTVAHIGYRNGIVGAQDLPAQAASALFFVLVVVPHGAHPMLPRPARNPGEAGEESRASPG
jgi:hypothetical protein